MNSRKISEKIIEMYLLNELPKRQMQEIGEELQRNPELKKLVKKIEESNVKILEEYPAEKVIDDIMDKFSSEEPGAGESKKNNNIFKFVVPPALAVLAAVLFLVIIPMIETSRDSGTTVNDWGTTRMKGSETSLFIYRKKAKKVEKLGDRSHARERDLLQIAYYSEKDSYGAVLSVDGRGTITLHYPKDLSRKPLLKVKEKVLLSHSYELDDAPSFEKFYFITARDNFDIKKVYSAVQKLTKKPSKILDKSLDIDVYYSQTSVIILKGK